MSLDDTSGPAQDNTASFAPHDLKSELTNYHDKSDGKSWYKYCCCFWKCDFISKHIDSLIDSFGIFYDILTMTVSMVDLVTDILVLIGYYQSGYLHFFWSSLSILCFAQLSYCLAFVIKNSDSDTSLCQQIVVFIFCIPFSPILSFVFYLTQDPQSWLSRCLVYGFFGFTRPRTQTDTSNVSKFRAWFEKKLVKHMGFILEASCEALPQSILQMIAIVYYNQTGNALAIISIFTSLFSVISKSFVFSVSAGKDFLTIMFYWLCAITDFFGIFFAVSWVFYQPESDNLDNDFVNNLLSSTIGQVWFWKVCLGVIPMSVIITLLMGLWTLNRSFEACGLACICFGTFAASFTMTFCIITLPITLEIFVYLFIAMYFERTYMSRFPVSNVKDMDAWNQLISFIYSNQGYDISDIASDFNHLSMESQFREIVNHKMFANGNSWRNDVNTFACSAKQDRIIRLCCINHAYYKGYAKIQLSNFNQTYENDGNVKKFNLDSGLRKYLENEEAHSFMRVKEYSDIDFHSSCGKWSYKDHFRKMTTFEKIWQVYGAFWAISVSSYKQRRYNDSGIYQGSRLIIVGLSTFILGPMYILSRVISILFPIIILVTSNLNQVDALQWSMLVIYSVLEMIVICLCGFLIFYWYHESFLLPNNELASLEPFGNEFVEYVTEYCYPQFIIAPIRDYLVRQVFGKDVGNLILSYLSDFSFDSAIEDFQQFLIKHKNVPKNHPTFVEIQSNCLGSDYQ